MVASWHPAGATLAEVQSGTLSCNPALREQEQNDDVLMETTEKRPLHQEVRRETPVFSPCKAADKNKDRTTMCSWKQRRSALCIRKSAAPSQNASLVSLQGCRQKIRTERRFVQENLYYFQFQYTHYFTGSERSKATTKCPVSCSAAVK